MLILPTRHERPVLLQPPLFTTLTKTSCAEFLGARAQRAAVVMIQPAMWPTNDTVSMIGSSLVPSVLKITVINTKAIMTSVTCQLLKVKSGL